MRSERSSGPVLRHLRQVTGTLHEALDASSDGQNILAGRIERDGYVRMLRAHWILHRFVASYMRHLQRQQPALQLLDWPACERIAALQSDLAALDSAALESLADAANLAPPQAPVSAAYACGLLYVVEGACHGTGQMLHALRKNQRFQSWGADRFMLSSRAEIVRRWPRTVALLEDHGGAQPDVAAGGAVAGFECYGAALASS